MRMRVPLLSLLALFCGWLLASAAVWAAPLDYSDLIENYQLGAGDQIEIQVFGEPDLSVTRAIEEFGSFYYPFLGEINAAGMTVGQLQRRIRDGLLGDYLLDPNVRVKVVEYRKIYLNGYVQRPGPYSYAPGMTVRKAIAVAGGFHERASRDKVYLVRGKVDGEADPEPRKADLDEDVKPGDVITVERSFF